MDILMVTAELGPYARASETGDSVAALSRALTQIGHKVTVALPKFEGIENSGLSVARRLSQLTLPDGEQVTVYDGHLPSGVGVVLFESKSLPARPDVFGDPAVEGPNGYADNPRRFVTLCQAALSLAEQRAQQGSGFDVLHACDWPAAPLTLLPRRRLPAVFTLHDASRQGQLTWEEVHDLGLDGDADAAERLRLDDAANLVKGALLSAEVAATVSPSYAQELKDTSRFGALASALSSEELELHGVLGGVDYATYNPAVDTALPTRFDAESPAKKGNCRSAVCRELGFELSGERPLVVFAGALDDTSGAPLVAQVLPALLRQDALVVLAGSPSAALSKVFSSSKFKRAEHYRFIATEELSSAGLSRRLLAAADIALCPSATLHTGHAVRVAQRYGALPVALAVAGNRDAVVDADAELLSGTGFLFEAPEPAEFLAAIERALSAWRHPRWPSLVKRVMRLDLGWERPARRYAQLYRMALTS
jgi:starch synthase